MVTDDLIVRGDLLDDEPNVGLFRDAIFTKAVVGRYRTLRNRVYGPAWLQFLAGTRYSDEQLRIRLDNDLDCAIWGFVSRWEEIPFICGHDQFVRGVKDLYISGYASDLAEVDIASFASLLEFPAEFKWETQIQLTRIRVTSEAGLVTVQPMEPVSFEEMLSNPSRYVPVRDV